jgi:hemerythrin-like domain-containing protein
MESVGRLNPEHDLIKRGLTLLEKAGARFDAWQPVPEGFPQRLPRFFPQFDDRCHHPKKEDVFSPVLKERGIPEQGGSIGVMLHEHELGRDCATQWRRRLGQAGAGLPRAHKD